MANILNKLKTLRRQQPEVGTFRRFVGIVKGVKDDSGHEHDSSNGQFTSGGGGSAATKEKPKKDKPKKESGGEDKPKGEPAEPEGAKADPGDRPKRPAKWKDTAEIASHAAKMAESHESDPHIKALQKKYDITKHFYDTLDKRDTKGMLYAEYEQHYQKKRELLEEMNKLDVGLEAEARRSLLASFSIPREEKDWVRTETARPNGPQAKAMKEARDVLWDLMSKDAVGYQYVTVKAARDRAYYQSGTIYTHSTDDPSISMHEFGHHLERLPWVQKAANDFHAKRFPKDKNIVLSKEFPEHGYGKDEVGNPDDMTDLFRGSKNQAAYAGKRYSDGQTEIVAMGLELLYRDPVHFAKTDPEYFGLIMGILQKGQK